MKQKYTLLISDMEINVITDEPQESVEYIVGILDRKIREITLKSKRCSKNEAALLCALDFCAEKLAVKERVEELENQLETNGETLKNLTEKLEMLQKNADRLEKENARLEADNAKLRAVLDDLRDRGMSEGKSSKVSEAEEPTVDLYAENPDEETDTETIRVIPNGEAQVSEQSAEQVSEQVVEQSSEQSAEQAAGQDSQKKKNNRTRVGSMFDLLTFSDI